MGGQGGCCCWGGWQGAKRLVAKQLLRGGWRGVWGVLGGGVGFGLGGFGCWRGGIGTWRADEWCLGLEGWVLAFGVWGSGLEGLRCRRPRGEDRIGARGALNRCRQCQNGAAPKRGSAKTGQRQNGAAPKRGSAKAGQRRREAAPKRGSTKAGQRRREAAPNRAGQAGQRQGPTPHPHNSNNSNSSSSSNSNSKPPSHLPRPQQPPH